MKVVATGIADVKLLEPRVFEDSRGLFFESYNERILAEFGILSRPSFRTISLFLIKA